MLVAPLRPSLESSRLCGLLFAHAAAHQLLGLAPSKHGRVILVALWRIKEQANGTEWTMLLECCVLL